MNKKELQERVEKLEDVICRFLEGYNLWELQAMSGVSEQEAKALKAVVDVAVKNSNNRDRRSE